MRIIALHNPSAGSQDHDRAELAERLKRCGHDVVAVVTHHHDLVRALRAEGCDLVVVAGGDGTVNKAARAARETTIPIAILPRGTANNLAGSIGVAGELEELAASWSSLPVRIRDAAVATWTLTLEAGVTTTLARRHVFECFGFGAFCRTMEVASAVHEASPGASAEEKLARDRDVFRRSLEDARAFDYHIEIDGVDHSGAYVMVEVMLIPFVGPRVELAPGAGRADGRADVVLVTEAERDALVRSLAAEPGRGGPDGWRPRSVRGSSVLVDAGAEQAHADGELCVGDDDGPLAGPVRVEVLPDAYRILAP